MAVEQKVAAHADAACIRRRIALQFFEAAREPYRLGSFGIDDKGLRRTERMNIAGRTRRSRKLPACRVGVEVMPDVTNVQVEEVPAQTSATIVGVLPT